MFCHTTGVHQVWTLLHGKVSDFIGDFLATETTLGEEF